MTRTSTPHFFFSFIFFLLSFSFLFSVIILVIFRVYDSTHAQTRHTYIQIHIHTGCIHTLYQYILAHTYDRAHAPSPRPLPCLSLTSWPNHSIGRDLRLTSSCIRLLFSALSPSFSRSFKQPRLVLVYKCPPTPTNLATLIDRDSIHRLPSGTLVSLRIIQLQLTIRQHLNTLWVLYISALPSPSLSLHYFTCILAQTTGHWGLCRFPFLLTYTPIEQPSSNEN